MNQTLHFIDYTIADNLLRAYRDGNERLVFVLDYATNEIKQNALLVMNPDGDRKWDDILSNDYGIDLESIRPKKDNKYQKLDIEYNGLDVYETLFSAHDTNSDLSDALAQLTAYRKSAARNSAQERLNAAEITANNARETIVRTGDTITQLQSRQKELRTKLSELRRNIGKEPTKQSAAKILRTESQLDTTNDKLSRANKRIQNAKHRLSAAQDEIELAQKILALTNDDDLNNNDIDVPAISPSTSVQVMADAPTPAVQSSAEYDTDDEEEIYEPKATDMADEEVKPLFDQDPNILDEELAFRPIDFTIPDTLSAPAEPDTKPMAISEGAQIDIERPMSFQPPIATNDPEIMTRETPADDNNIETAQPEPQPMAPMLDNLTPVELPAVDDFTNTPNIQTEQTMEEYSMPITSDDTTPVLSTQSNDFAAAAPAPGASYGYTAADTGERPASPYTGSDARPASPMAYQTAVQPTQRTKPTFLYYILLILLIALSIFTLWIYQQKATQNTPELGATQPVVTTPVIEPAPAPAPAPEVPFDQRPETITGSVAEPVSEPTPEIPTESEILATKPVYNVGTDDKLFVAAPDYESDDTTAVESAANPEPESESVTVSEEIITAEKQPVEIIEPVIVPVPEPEPVVLPEPEPVVIPEPEPVVMPEPEPVVMPEPEPVVMPKPESVTYKPTTTPQPAYTQTATTQNEKVPQSVTSEVYTTTTTTYEPAAIDTTEYVTTEVINTCADGNMPDMYGCCNGEEFVDFGENGQLCCVIGSDECFEPLLN